MENSYLLPRSVSTGFPVKRTRLFDYPAFIRTGLALIWVLLGVASLSQAQVYYTLSDGGPTTMTDQLRRINLDGTGDVLIRDNYIQTPGDIALDVANNRLLIIDIRTSQATTSLTNTKIVAVSLAPGNAVSTLITPTYITGAASMVVGGVALDRVNNYLYYTLSDGGPTTMTDQLRRINLDGTGDVLIRDNYIQTPGRMVLDVANNRLLIIDIRTSQATTSLTNTKIVAVSLAPGNAVSTLITPTYITGAASMVIGGLTTTIQDPPTVTTASVTAFGSNSATLGGNVTANGGVSVTERGVVYSSTSTTPAIGSGTKVQVGTGTGAFSQTVSSLTGSTTYYVRAYAINAAGTSYGAVQSFTTPAPNTAPTDIGLTPASVAENQVSGTTVGTLSTTDANAGQTFSYSLVSGAGSTDNGSFQITGGQLRTNAVFDFEVKNSYAIRIRTTDNGSPALSFDKSFTISVTNVNETPVISPQSFTVNENSANGTVVGAVAASDPDAGTTLSYSILTGNTGGAFTFVGNSLRVANTTALDFETTPVFSLSVRVSDGTLSATATVTVNLNNLVEGALSISPATPAVVCAGSPVSLTATPTGFAPTGYTWSSLPAGFADSGASLTAFTQNAPVVGFPTTYTVTASATDGTNTSVASVTVLVKATPTLTVGTGTNPTTCGGGNGSIAFPSVNLTNGVYSLTYTGSGSPRTVVVSSNAFDLQGLSAGTYSNFSITSFGCIGSVVASRTLTDPAPPVAGVGGSQSICSGSTATLSATATNGTGIWSVLSGPSTLTNQFNNTASATAIFTPTGGAGNYVLRWTVSNGACTPAIGDVIITVKALPTLTVGVGTNPTACGAATGSIAFTSTNLPDGTYSLTYTGSGSPRTVTVSGNAFSLTGLSAGGYSNFSISNFGCIGSVATSVTLNDPTAPTVTLGNSGPLSCTNASVTLTATAGLSSYTFSSGATQVGSSTGNTATVTSAGVYSVNVVNASGCTASASTTVTGNTTAPTASLTNNGPLSCTTTSVTLTAGGGGTYAFSSGATQIGSTNVATVSSAGTYSVIVTGTNGCTATAQTTVTGSVNAPLAFISQPLSATTVPVGANVAATASVSGTGSISYQWYKNSLANAMGGQTSATLTLLNVQLSDAGSYSVVATGPCNSVTSTAFNLTVSPNPLLVALSANPTTLLTTGSTSLSASVSGGTSPYSYSFTGPGAITPIGNTATVSGLSAGVQTFTVTVTDATSPTNQTASATVSVTVNAANQPPVATANANQTATVGVAFTYTVNAFTDETPASLTYTASISPANSLSFNPATRIISGTPSVSGVSTVTVTATDPGSLSASTSFTITVSPAPVVVTSLSLVVTASPTTLLTTGSTTLSASVSGGTSPYSYSFTGPGTITPIGNTATVSGLSAGVQTFTVTVSDASSPTSQTMTATVSVTVTVTAPAPVNQPPTTTGIANQTGTVGQAFTLLLSPFFSDPESQTLAFSVSGLPAGLSLSGSTISGAPSVSGVSTVTVTATDPGSLSVTASFTLTVSPAPVTVTAPFAITGVTTVSCTPITPTRYGIIFSPRYTGLSGTLISFSVVNELLPTTAAGPYTLQVYTDNPVITLKAIQSGTAGEASFVYNWLAACNGVTPPVNAAPTTTGIANQSGTVSVGFSLNVASSFSDPNGDALTFTVSGLPAGLSLSGSIISGAPSVSGVSTVTVTATDPGSLSVSASFTLTVSPASVVVPPTSPFSITGVTTVSCTTTSAGQRQLSFTPRYAGLSGQPVSFSVVNEMLPTTAAGPYILNSYIDNPVLNLRAIQTGTAGEVSFAYNWLAACGTGVGNATARLRAEPTTPLRVSVLGNPVVGGSVDVEVQGAQGQSLRLVLTDMQGHVVAGQSVESAGVREHQTLKIGRAAGGILLLRVSTATQEQVVKVLVP